MKRRKTLLTAAIAGLAALGTVMAQQPGYPTPLPPSYMPKQQSGVQPAGGYQPPGSVQPAVGSKPRLTSPAVAGGDLRPVSGTFPPPNMDLPSPSPVPSVPAVPSIPRSDSKDSKFPPLPLPIPVTGTPIPSLSPSAPMAGDLSSNTPALPSSPVIGSLPAPVPPATPASPREPVTPTVPSAPGLPAASSPFAAPTFPSAPTAPSAFPAATPTTPALPGAFSPPTSKSAHDGVLPARTAPSVTIEAVCPESVAYGQEFTYKLVVRNAGTFPVAGIRIDDEIPAGSRYIGSDPATEIKGDRLTWTIASLDAGAEKTIAVRVKPSEEGEIRSRATVSFSAAVDARTRVTRPRLAVAAGGLEICRAGEEATFRIKVTNSGSGPAPKYVIRAQLSDGLIHSQGAVVEAPMEALPAGESKLVELKVTAVKSGLQWCQVTVSAEGSSDATAKVSTNVVEPLLVVKQTGPAKCLVRAEPTFTIELSNPGTAATDPVLLQTVLPDGFEWMNQASDNGTCSGRTVTWRLPSLAAGSTRSVTLKLRAAAATDATGSSLRTVAHAGPANLAPAAVPGAAPVAVRPARGLEAKAETTVVAEGVAAVRFDVVGLENPVAVGKELTYEIRVMNSGTGPCSNVQVAAALADGMEFIGATTGNNQGSPVKAFGQQLTFDPIPSLGVKGETVYRVRVKATAPGDLRIRVQLSCDQLKTPVVKEESTTFVKE